MSQVIFHTPKYRVMAGWDYPLQHFFLTVETNEVNEEDDADELDNIVIMDDAKSTEPLKKALEKIGVTAPPKFWDYVELQERNIQYFYDENNKVDRRDR